MNINRLVHPGFWFGKTDKEYALKLARMGVGGFCLYGGTRAEVSELTKALRAASPLKRILISADYEDGLGRWLPDAELFPSNLALGAADDEKLSYEKGFLTARQAKSLGIDWIFAPVLDLADNPDNPIVNTRSFGSDPEKVTRLAGAFMDGLAKGGTLNAIKHFPGHGNTATDSHLALPVLLSTKQHILEHELIPFRQLLNKADCVMVGHLLAPALDEQYPASVSPTIIGGLLQQEMGFNGCICTDALCMKALRNAQEAALAAFLAGAHILLVPEDPLALLAFLNAQDLPPDQLTRAIQIQNILCARADEVAASSQAAAFGPTDFSDRTARKALTLLGSALSVNPGETLHYLSVGNDEQLQENAFLDALQEKGVIVKPFNGQADKLAVLCWRRYQAYKAKIGLLPAEKELILEALKKSKENIIISFANPWMAASLPCQGKLFTFSPAAPFQKAAAAVLLGSFIPQGKMPIAS